MKKIISMAIMVIIMAACTGNRVENGCWSSSEYKLYNVFPSQYFININGKSVTQSVYLEDPNDANNNMFTLWEGEIKERTESERGIEILVKYNKVEHYRKDTVIEVKNLVENEQEAVYRIANDTLSSLRLPVQFTKCRKGDIPTANDYKSGRFGR